MILEHLIHFIGALLKHIVGVLLLCWRRMLRSGLIAFFIGVVVTILVAVIATGKAIPSVGTMIVALLLGLGLAYGVALTVLVEEMILGAIDLVKILEGDVAAGAHIAEVVAEREVGEVGQGLRRLIGLPVTKRGPDRPGAALPLIPRMPVPARPLGRRAPVDAAVAGAAVAGAAAVGAAALAAERRPAPANPAPTTPDLPADAQGAAPVEALGAPVPADRLPRISWTLEHDAVRPPAPSAPPPISPAPSSAAPFSPAPALTHRDASPPFAPPNPPMPSVSPVIPLDEVPATPIDQQDTLTYQPDRLDRLDHVESAPVIADAVAPEEAAPIAEAAATAPSAEPIEVAQQPVADAITPVASEEPAVSPIHRAAGVLSVLGEIGAGLVASHALDIFTHHEPQHDAPADAPVDALAMPAATADEQPYEDERLAAPLSVMTPEGPAEPAERVDEVEEQDEPVAQIAPLAREAEAAPFAAAPYAPPEPPAEPAPPTVPLVSDPADTSPASPFAPPAGEPEVGSFAALEMEPPATPAPATTPLARAANDTRPIPPTPQTAAAPPRVPADTRPIPVVPEPQPTPNVTPAMRADGARRTLPLGGEAPLDGARPSVPSQPRASAPESGLWERLSSALINRAGTPSSPFAAPQGGADEPATEPGVSEQESR